MKDVKCIISNENGRTCLRAAFPAETADDMFAEWKRITAETDVSLVPISDIIDPSITDIEAQVQALMNCGHYHDVWRTDDILTIEIIHGDWHHDHAFIKDLMATVFDNLTYIGETVTEPSDDDSFSAEHRYRIA